MAIAGPGPEGHLPPEIGEEEVTRWRRALPDAIAVTGASGFVGHHVVDALLRCGRRPRLLLRDPRRLAPTLAASCDVVVGDLGDGEALAQLVRGQTLVVHLAGVVRAGSSARFFEANARGTARLVAALSAAAPTARLVHVSSLAAAGPSPRPEGRGPEEEPAPISAYGRSKLAGEAAVRELEGAWTVIRPPAIYGPRDTDMFQFFRLAARGVVPLPAGERWVTVAHVSDVVRAILQAADGRTDRRTLHVGEPAPRPMRELVAVLARAGGVSTRVLPLPAGVFRAAGLVGDGLQRLGFRRVAMTSDKARELVARHWSARTADSLAALGLAGAVPFLAGAAHTWSWYRSAGWLPHGKMHPARTGP